MIVYKPPSGGQCRQVKKKALSVVEKLWFVCLPREGGGPRSGG